jgi:thioesterase domain-containing protein
MGALAHHHPEGRRPPLVFVRTWGVEGDYLGRLAEHLDPEQPVIGLAPPSSERAAKLDRVGDWVEFEREQLDSLSLSGPYRLAGWSFGGVVALELARTLEADGVGPASLDLVDTWLPRQHPRNATERALLHLLKIQALEASQRRAYVRSVARRLPKQARKLARAQTRRVGRTLRRGEAPAKPSVEPELRAIWVPFMKYEPSQYHEPVAIHSSADSVARNNDDPSLGWSRWLVGGFSVRHVAGKHRTMWDPPHVAGLAAGLVGADDQPNEVRNRLS